jgi:hypothetical protein
MITNKEAITKSPLATNKMARHPQSKLRDVNKLGMCFFMVEWLMDFWHLVNVLIIA